MITRDLAHYGQCGLICDKCGREFSHGGRKSFASAMAAVEAARSQGWKAPKSAPFSDMCPACRKAANKQRR